MLSFVFFLFIIGVSSQEFKQFIFPQHLASALDAAAENPSVLSPRGVVTSISIPESEEALNDPGRPYPAGVYSVPPQNAYPQPNYPKYPQEPQQPNFPSAYLPPPVPAPRPMERPVVPPSAPVETPFAPPSPQYPMEVPEYPMEVPEYPIEVPQIPVEVPQAPVRVPPSPAGPKEPYEINYCNKAEFPDPVLADHSLERIEYFIYNKSCSGTFFQCSIGQTFLFTCLSTEQAFDPSIVNCNYKYDNRICPEFDHITHCTIKETCTENQYACCAEPQMCIDLSRRCDSHPDCSNGEDETNCPSCAMDEFACVKSACWGKFVCDSPQTIATLGHSECIEYELHCNGEKNCPGGEDEINCRQTGAKYLLCENQKQSVLKEQWCDGQEHCADGSDERYCY
ncbi:hypothetical protein FO519_003339 [Halicephalobus sp. NKZ332]|nr:hypothetical protein FO519_003339 [Halicephalobus sp. NKZ332]